MWSILTHHRIGGNSAALPHKVPYTVDANDSASLRAGFYLLVRDVARMLVKRAGLECEKMQGCVEAFMASMLVRLPVESNRPAYRRDRFP